MNTFFTPPDHVHFLARKLYGKGQITDVSIAHLEKNGGGPAQNHTHVHDHLFFVTEGEAEIILDKERVILHKNDSYLVPGSIPHSVWNHSGEQTTMIGISVMPEENEKRE